MVYKTIEPPTLLAELHRRANLVHGLSKDDQALELARLVLRVVPQLESLVQQASSDGHGSLVSLVKSLESFVSVAGSLAITLHRPLR